MEDLIIKTENLKYHEDLIEDDSETVKCGDIVITESVFGDKIPLILSHFGDGECSLINLKSGDWRGARKEEFSPTLGEIREEWVSDTVVGVIKQNDFNLALVEDIK